MKKVDPRILRLTRPGEHKISRVLFCSLFVYLQMFGSPAIGGKSNIHDPSTLSQGKDKLSKKDKKNELKEGYKKHIKEVYHQFFNDAFEQPVSRLKDLKKIVELDGKTIKNRLKKHLAAAEASQKKKDAAEQAEKKLKAQQEEAATLPEMI